MRFRRVLRDLNEYGRALVDPEIEVPNDEVDGFEITGAARDFSKATRKVVDEKLTFSAALMRAGEIDEANKILAEVEHDVRNEEAALLERMNEVSAKRAVGRAHLTRLRLVRLLATAMVGAGILGVSAMGMAVAGMFERGQKNKAHKDRREVRLADARSTKRMEKLMIGDVALKLSKRDLQTFRQLTSGGVDTEGLEYFLATDLDLPPGVVDETLATVLSLAAPVVDDVEQVAEAATPAVETAADAIEVVKKKADDATKDESQVEEPPAEEPTEQPDPEPTPKQTPGDDDDDDGGNGGGGDGGDGDQKGALPEVNGL